MFHFSTSIKFSFPVRCRRRVSKTCPRKHLLVHILLFYGKNDNTSFLFCTFQVHILHRIRLYLFFIRHIIPSSARFIIFVYILI
ncbi:hypothetical protein BRYFOR_08122 [Marvinbryantia formatexigens DSM 14469]|uniref:Uncharacterized protein n=1 Tax=Marvinbryantia formatexigens DSM 14469 TaxID=478749 RepID=C6LHL0_9FIRM|nr:hypothetical protein BRYFOR_08122 [Marvinbryantia formatexigens DSM 14469]